MSKGTKRFAVFLAAVWVLGILWQLWRRVFLLPPYGQQAAEGYERIAQSKIVQAVFACVRLQAFTFMGMAALAAFLIRCRRVLRTGAPGGALAALAAAATALMALHVSLSRFALEAGLRYDLSDDGSLLGMIGTATWLTGTPGLYVLILVLCLGFAAERRRKSAAGGEA